MEVSTPNLIRQQFRILLPVTILIFWSIYLIPYISTKEPSSFLYNGTAGVFLNVINRSLTFLPRSTYTSREGVIRDILRRSLLIYLTAGCRKLGASVFIATITLLILSAGDFEVRKGRAPGSFRPRLAHVFSKLLYCYDCVVKRVDNVTFYCRH